MEQDGGRFPEGTRPNADELMRGLLEGSPDATAIIDTQRRYVAYNAPYRTLLAHRFGLEPALGEPVFTAWAGPAADRPLRESIEKSLAGQQTNIDVPCSASEAGTAPLCALQMPIRTDRGEVCAVLHIVRESRPAATPSADVERPWLRLGKAIERSLTADHMAASRDVERVRIFAWDADQGRSLWSGPLEAFAQTLLAEGTPPGERPATELVHPDDANRLAQKLAAWRREGRREAFFDFRVVRDDGSERWMEAWAKLIPATNGRREKLLGISVDVTDLAEAERQLQQTQAAYKRLFEASIDGLVLIDLGQEGVGRILQANPALVRMLGRPSESIEGRPITDFTAPDERQRLHSDLRIVRERRTLRHEFDLLHADGVKVCVEASSRLFDDDGRLRVLSVLRDVTDRKAAEERLRRSEQHYRALSEATPQIVWAAESDGYNDYFNASWVTYTGLSLADSTGTGWTKAVDPQDVERLATEWNRAVTSQQTFESEGRLVRHDGASRWFLHRAYPVTDPSGRPMRWIGTSMDIHAIKTGEFALREREGWLGQIVDTIPHMVWTANARGAVEFQSHPLVEYVGDQQLVSDWLPWAGLFHPDDRPRARSMWKRMVSGSAGGSDEFRLRRHDGLYHWFAVAASPLKDEHGGVVRWIGTWTDIDQRKAAEELLRESDRRKDEFLAVLSHELRNPLAPIRNGISILARAPAGSAPWKRALEIIHRQSDQLTRLVDDLLDITRINRGKIRLHLARLDLGELVRRSVEDLRDEFDQRGVRIFVNAPPHPVWVNGDAIRLSQALGNLLQNAAKFTPRGGQASVTLEPFDGLAKLIVHDNGSGIDPALLPKLFTPFIQAESSIDRSRGGLGLGLALVRGLVEMHGGTVCAASEGPGQGASFTVTLPVEPAPSVGRDAATASASGARRVLIVEDNVDAAECLKTLLEMDGHEAQIAASGPDGVAAAKALHPDVVLCDIGLPGMDGYEVARTLRADASLADTRLYALSGYAGPEDVRRACEAGFMDLIPKPASAARLAQTVAGRPHVPEPVG